MTYAFVFDSSTCSGCKACQEACKDKNGLPVGVLWRRVIEVTGGEWVRRGQAWENSVFAYSLSIGCNHCENPSCAEVCPTNAYTIRLDGIVLLDSSKCMGCGYCAWACPYGAPQYNPARGVMTKCDLCVDRLESGLPPVCVAACPLRSLELRIIEECEPLPAVQALWQVSPAETPFPLMGEADIGPHLALKPHPAMASSLPKTVANREEIRPPHPGKLFGTPVFDELPLVAFTLLIQMAVGLSVCLLTAPQLSPVFLLSLGGLIGLAGLISFLHLGRKQNASRALVNLDTSWLSREVALSGLFAASWVLNVGLTWLQIDFVAPWLMVITGISLIYAMSRIYCIDSMPAWNTWQTPLSFFASAAVLGLLGMNIFLPHTFLLIMAGVVLLGELLLTVDHAAFVEGTRRTIRILLLGLLIVGSFLLVAIPQARGIGSGVLLLLLALAEEILDRISFYALPLARLI